VEYSLSLSLSASHTLALFHILILSLRRTIIIIASNRRTFSQVNSVAHFWAAYPERVKFSHVSSLSFPPLRCSYRSFSVILIRSQLRSKQAMKQRIESRICWRDCIQRIIEKWGKSTHPSDTKHTHARIYMYAHIRNNTLNCRNRQTERRGITMLS